MINKLKSILKTFPEQFARKLIEAQEILLLKYEDVLSEKERAEAEASIKEHKEEYRRKYNGDFR
ncbi:MAG: hypothetical protein IKW37_01620 [Bacteroidaceae bacterium]|nr:hypothetical protein [Bacteroidaceae bacterium]